jgi:hypothetical protein
MGVCWVDTAVAQLLKCVNHREDINRSNHSNCGKDRKLSKHSDEFYNTKMWVRNAHENCVLALITPLHDYYYYNHHHHHYHHHPCYHLYAGYLQLYT